MPVALGIMLAACGSAQAAAYQLTLLDNMGSGAVDVRAINNVGQIVGVSGGQATQWLADGHGSVLGSGGNSGADDINDAGQIVGYQTDASGTAHAVVWQNGTSTLLAVPDQQSSYATGINNAGAITGRYTAAALSGNTVTTVSRGAIWNDASATPGTLPALLSPDSVLPASLNNLGQVAGTSTSTVPTLPGEDPAYSSAAVVWANGQLKSLQTSNSIASDINDQGQVVGWSNLGYHFQSLGVAELWDAAGEHALTQISEAFSKAFEINALGQIVGTLQTHSGSNFGLDNAVLWENGNTVNLNSLLDPDLVAAGWRLSSANAINDQGWIAGNAVNDLTHQTAGFLLRPSAVPEAATGGMWLVGLALVGATVRRARGRSAV
ncbi:MAG: hypothetical protein QM749_03050 [Aquabacterium sp.]